MQEQNALCLMYVGYSQSLKLRGYETNCTLIQEFQNLYQHENCSDFMLDLLQFIETKLLRMNSKNRAKCDGVADKFKELYDRCSRDRQYCTRRTMKPPSRKGTDLSLLSPAAIDVSPEMEKRINKNRLEQVPAGPIETGTNSESSDAKRFSIASRDFGFPGTGKAHQESDWTDSETPSRAPTPPAITAATHSFGHALTPSNSNNSEPRPPRPQSPLRNERKLYFPRAPLRDRNGSIRDLHVIPAEDETPTETTRSMPTQSDPPPESPTQSHPPHGTTHPTSMPELPEKAVESSTATSHTSGTTSQHNSPIDKTSASAIEAQSLLSTARDASQNVVSTSEIPKIKTEDASLKSGADQTENSANPPSVAPPITPSANSSGPNTAVSDKQGTEGSKWNPKKRLKDLLKGLWCFG